MKSRACRKASLRPAVINRRLVTFGHTDVPANAIVRE